ncbi:MAG: hypothetical protein QM571_01490 [Micrococcaceae bacterium]
MPAFFVVLLYIYVGMFGSQIINSFTEEKENRVTEILLTSVFGLIMLRIATLAFRKGSLEYSKVLSAKTLFKK